MFHSLMLRGAGWGRTPLKSNSLFCQLQAICSCYCLAALVADDYETYTEPQQATSGVRVVSMPFRQHTTQRCTLIFGLYALLGLSLHLGEVQRRSNQ